MALRIGMASARTNLVPMISLWILAAALLFVYYLVPGFAAMLEPIRDWQNAWGWRAAFANGLVFCGLLPGVFLFAVRSLRVRRLALTVFAQSVWAGLCGVIGGWMYDLNAQWFGEGSDAWTLIIKTAVCQFLWTPLLFNPLGSAVYAWIGCDFTMKAFKGRSLAGFWQTVALPNLIMNWIIWIPCTLVVIVFPTALQIQLSGLVNCFFALVQLMIGRGK